MSAYTHAVVWIDHHEARIIFFSRDATEEAIVRPEHTRHHLHSKAGSHEGYRAPEDHAFYQEVATDLSDALAFFVVGPANAKTEFVKHLEQQDRSLAGRLAGVEPMDKVTDGELLAAARHFFKRADRM